MRVIALASTLLLSACILGRGPYCLRLPDHVSAEQAYRILLFAPQFEGRSIGISDSRSCTFAAYELLLRDRNAASYFEHLYEHGTTPAKIYALDGLRQTNRERYAELRRERFFTSSQTVRVQSGCVVRDEKVSGLTQAIEAGGFRGF